MEKTLRITIEKNTEIAKGILSKTQFFMYNMSTNGLLAMLISGLKKFKAKKDGNVFIFEEVGTPEYIELAKKRLESFLFSDEKEIRGDKYAKYRKYANNRLIMKISRTAHKYKNKIKDKGIRAALGGSDVFSFFSKIGIFIKWGIYDKEKPKIINKP